MNNGVPFYKMSGSGNDFIVIDNRNGVMRGIQLDHFIRRVCRRRMSVGADGLILIEDCPTADFKWQFFNADGSRAEMCGNGARCAGRFAYLHGIAGNPMSFETDVGTISAQIIEDRVKINMTDPADLVLAQSVALNGGSRSISRINTGVPHVVLEVPDLSETDVVGIGREIRYHPDFAPQGTNVNFISRLREDRVAVRTYERGVEDETLACGTGAVAAALVCAARFGKASPIKVQTRSDSILSVHFEPSETGFRQIFLEGDARVIYAGEITPEAWNW